MGFFDNIKNMFTSVGGIINTGKGLTGLHGLSWQNKMADNAFDYLNNEEKKRFIKSQVEAGLASYDDSDDLFNQLYKEQQFIDRFGLDEFNQLSREARDEKLKHQILLEEYDKRYDPYKRDEKGNILLDENGKKIIDSTKGMGDANDYEKYRRMTSEGLEELLGSDYITRPERQRITEEREKQRRDKANAVGEAARQHQEEAKKHGWFRRTFIDPLESGGYAQAYSGAATKPVGSEEAEQISDAHTEVSNEHLIENIYAKDLKKQEAYLENAILAQRDKDDKELSSDKAVKKEFLKMIKPNKDEGYIGNPILYQHFTEDGGKRSNEVMYFSIADMRDYIARAKVLNKYLGPQAAFDALDFSAREYLEDHETNWESTKRHAEEFGLTLLNYGTSMIRGWENDAAMSDTNDYTVYQDNKGRVVQTDMVKVGTAKDGENLDGKYYIVDKDGNKQIVHQVQMTKSELLQQGKDTDGVDKPWYLNNRAATDSQRFNIAPWNEEALARANEVGASSSSPIYAPGDEASIWWETAKMGAFPIMDIIAMAIPTGIGAAGKALGAGSKIGRVLSVTGKVGRAGVALSSAAGIGHDYGTGVFGEALEANMSELEHHAYTVGQNQFYDNYTHDAQYKATLDKEISETAKQMMAEDPELTEEGAMTQAKAMIQEREIQKFTEQYKNEDPNGEYSAGLQEASASAAHAANVASVTDAIKYGAVNLFGYRSFLYKSPEKLASSHLGRFFKAIEEDGTKLALKKAWNAKGTLGRTALSQFRDGFWTNFTDEMQSEGGRAINEDRFAAFMNNEYDGEGAVQAYSDINSYFAGAARALAKPHTWQAGLVGGLGSIVNFTPNIGGVVEHLVTREGRESWRNMSTGERMNAVLTNGILNNYYAQKNAYQNAENTVQLVNKMLDDNKDFQALADALAVNTAATDATNENDANVMRYLKAVQAMQILNDMGKDGAGRDKLFDAIAMKSTTVQEALENVKKIANGEFTTEDAQQHVQSYYDANAGLAKSPENDKIALNNVIANARYLQEVNDKLAEVNRTIDKHEEVLGTEFHPTVRNKIAQRMAVDGFLRRTSASNEEAITGAARDGASVPRSIQSYGSVTARSNMLKGITNRISRVQSHIDEAQAVVDEKKEALEQFMKDKDVKTEADVLKLTRSEQDKYADLVTDYINSKLQLGYHQQIHGELTKTAELLKEHDGKTPKVLTAAEIIMLSPTDRARMLDPENAHNYSKNQLVEINKAKEELVKKDPKLLQLIQDQASIARSIESNSRVYTTMLSNPEAALVQVQAMHDASVKAATANLTNRRIEALDKQVEYLSKVPDVDSATIGANIFQQLSKANTDLLEAILDKDPSEIPSLSKYRAEVQRALDVSKTMDNILVAINNMKLSQADTEHLIDNIDQLLDANDAQTRAEILDVLQTVADEQHPNFNPEDGAKFKKLLQELQTIEDLDSSTRIISKDLAKANNDATIKEQAEQTRRTRQAETEAKRQVEEERASKEAAERAKVQAVANAERQANAFISPYSTGQYSTKVSRANDGTITTKFNKYKRTSHGGKRQTEGGVPIDPSTVVDNENASSVELLTLKEKGGRYSGTVRVKEGDEWSTKNVQFNSNPIATPRSSRARQAAPQQAPAQQAPATEAPQATPQPAAQAPQQSAQQAEAQAQPQAQSQQQAPEAAPTAEAQGETTQEEIPAENAPTADEQAQAAHHNLTAEDNASPEAQLSDEAIAQGLEEAEEVSLESPTLEEQVAAIPEDQATVEIVPVAEQEKTEEQLDTLPTIDPGEVPPLSGNKFPGFDIKALADEGKEVPAKGQSENDVMSKIHKWLSDAGINLQAIIDHELGKIIQAHPNTKIHFLRVNPQNNATNDTAMQKSALLAIEYTNEVARIHKAERGGVVNANGKQYLIVGIFGHEEGNQAQKDYYNDFMDGSGRLKQRAWGYFQHNPSERFWVDPDNYTGVFYISNGRIVRQTVNDSEVQLRTIRELLFNDDGTINEERNPDGYQLGELQWGIQQERECVIINVPDRSAIDFVKDVSSNIGSVFLFAPTANGRLVPLFIRPVKLQELRQGALVDEIREIMTRLASPEHSERVKAVTQLTQRIVISQNGLQILVGNQNRDNVTIQFNGVDVAHYELSARDFSVQDIVNTLFNLNPRVNVTAGVLSNVATLRMYDDAGALLTDAAKLGTSNAKVLVHPVGADGKPIVTTPVDTRSNTDPANNSDLSIASRKLKQAETLNGVTYRKAEDGTWYTDTGRQVTDPRLVQQIEYNNMIRANSMFPAYQGRSSSGEVTEYYIISSDRNNPKVLARVTRTRFVQMLSAQDSLATLDFLARKQAEEQREAEIEAANRRAAEQGEDVDLTDNTQPQAQRTSQSQATQQTETLTDEQLMAQAMGDFESNPQAQAEAQADELVDQVTTGIDNAANESRQNPQPAPTPQTPTKSALELSTPGQGFTAEEVIRGSRGADVIRVLKDKGLSGKIKISDAIQFLQRKEMPIIGITDVDAWIDMLNNCR